MPTPLGSTHYTVREDFAAEKLDSEGSSQSAAQRDTAGLSIQMIPLSASLGAGLNVFRPLHSCGNAMVDYPRAWKSI